MTPCEAKTAGVLLGNAAFSFAAGVGFLIAGPLVAAALNPALPPLAVQAMGAALIGFAAVLVLIARMERLPRRVVWVIVAMDLSWVLASVAALAAFGGSMSPFGATFVWVVALAVAGFALFQSGGLLKSRGSAAVAQARV